MQFLKTTPWSKEPRFGAPTLWKKFEIEDRKGTTKKLCDKDLPNVRVNFLVRFASTPLFYWEMTLTPSNCSEDSLVLFARIFGLVGPFRPQMKETATTFSGFLIGSDRKPADISDQTLGCPLRFARLTDWWVEDWVCHGSRAPQDPRTPTKESSPKVAQK